MISHALKTQNSFALSRFGSVEIQYYLWITNPLTSRFLFQRVKKSSHRNAGIFPWSDECHADFVNEINNSLPNIDILGSWRLEERFLFQKLRHMTKIKLHNLLPYFGDNWLLELNKKKVLVIHPFKETIFHQYENRNSLFTQKAFIPNFLKLEVLVPPQTHAYHTDGYNTWTDALSDLKKKVSAVHDFDVAIIGCGSYGMPIAAHIKTLGKTALHLGGATQLIFGIHGRRWDADNRLDHLKTSNWIRPFKSDIITNSKLVEDGCYW